MCCVAGVLQHDPDRASGPVLGDGVCRGGEGGRCSDERRRGAGLLVRHHQRGGRDRVRQRGDQGTADRRQVQHCASLSLSLPSPLLILQLKWPCSKINSVHFSLREDIFGTFVQHFSLVTQVLSLLASDSHCIGVVLMNCFGLYKMLTRGIRNVDFIIVNIFVLAF